MYTNQLAPDISILMDDNEFKGLVDSIRDSEKRIEEITRQIVSYNNTLNETLFKVCAVLLKCPAATRAFEEEDGSDVELHSSLDERFINEHDCSLMYNATEGYDAQVTLVFDDEDESIVSFPLSFAIRADWLAKMEVYIEAAKIKEAKREQDTTSSKETEELKLLRTLLDKYKDKI